MSVLEELGSRLFPFQMWDRNAGQNQDDSLHKSLKSIKNSDMIARSVTTDILATPKEYIFYIDVPGFSKSDIQVELEDENLLVIKSNGKRKREDEDEKDCKYLKLERRPHLKFMRKFKLPQDTNASAITAKCESGVLSVTVPKAEPAKPKTVQVAVS